MVASSRLGTTEFPFDEVTDVGKQMVRSDWAADLCQVSDNLASREIGSAKSADATSTSAGASRIVLNSSIWHIAAREIRKSGGPEDM